MLARQYNHHRSKREAEYWWGKTKRERELPDIQTGSFHSHYCIFKRQVLTAHFCSARKEGCFFFFFPFGLFEISAWMFLFLFQQMDKQMGHYGYVECSGRKVETETARPGYSWLSPSQCSCNFPDMCLWTWRDGYPWESWWQVLTSIIRVGCNIKRNHGYLKILFGVRSWCDWRATTELRTGGRQLKCGKLFSTLKKGWLTKVLANIFHPLVDPLSLPV